jgi:hypothetical protein
MKKSYWIAGSIVLALVLMGASFYGGTLFERYTQARTRSSFLASRGLNGDTAGGAPGATSGQFGGRTGFGGGAQGQVKSIEGNTITLSTAQNVTTVTLSDSTTILKSVTGTIADLKVGDQVRVSGQADSSGAITANSITVMGPAGLPGAGGNGGPNAAPTATP